LVNKQKEKEIVLVQRLAKNDVQAFNELYNLYSRRIFGFAYGFLRSKEEAEGIVQEVFVKIWETRNNLRSDLSFSWFLFTIARNLILNKLQHHQYEMRYQKDFLAETSGDDNNTEEQVFYRDMSDHINNLIMELPPKRKEIFLLSRFEGLSYQEISEKLNISVKTVEVQISLALKYIRARIKKITPVILLSINLLSIFRIFLFL
jgi:RNA polymerase sigma-70 factor (ECF subfamily)